MLNAFLQRPVMIDRPLKAGQVDAWCQRVKSYVNYSNAYGKTNLHHQVQLVGENVLFCFVSLFFFVFFYELVLDIRMIEKWDNRETTKVV